MKKILFLFLAYFAIAISNCTAQTVYITKTSSKYHVENCRYLSESKIAIQLKDGIERGYQPCKVCHPPISIDDSKQKQTVYKPRPSNNNNNNAHGARIGRICNDGTRSNATGRGACSHHGGVNHWLYN